MARLEVERRNSFVRRNYLAGKLPNLLIDYLTVELNNQLKQGYIFVVWEKRCGFEWITFSSMNSL